MGSLVLLRNPLTPHTRETFPIAPGTPVIDWLQEKHPKGFGMPIRFYMNGTEQALDDLDMPVGEDDVAVIALMPGEPGTITLSAILIQLAIGAVLAGASIALNYFFTPKERSGAKGKAITIYDVASDQNAAKIGEAVPVVYGSVLHTPDYIAQPYSFYTWSQANFDEAYSGIQYLDMLLCVGQGNIDVPNIYLGDTDASTITSGVVTWRAFKPADHGKVMGTIASAMGGGFWENVVSSPEVGNQEFVNAGDSAGFFATCKPGVAGSRFQIDIVFPAGQFSPDNSGDIQGRTTYFDLSYQELDDNDSPVGTITTVSIKTSCGTATSVTGPNITSVTTSSVSNNNKTAIASPLRRSYMITAPRSARWAVKITRVTGAPNAKNGTDRFIWAGLKLYADYPAGTVYGDVTLLAVRIKASMGLGNESSVRIKVRANRRLAPPAGGAEAQSTSGADAFADVLTNTVYGAKRPLAELDTTTLTSLRTKWSAYQFNYVFRERITVWEALRTITTPFGAEPIPVGPVMSVAQDGVKSLRSMLFTDANIVANTLNVNYSFDEEGSTDGVEIEYLDPKDFRQVYTRYPTTSVRPDQYTLPGVTNATHAAQYARLTWQRRQGQRKRITFDTELEGLLLQLGDRIGVAHNVMKWGDSGLIVGMTGSTILIVDHDLDWTGGAKQILLRKDDGSVTDPITVTRGTSDNRVVLPYSNPIPIRWDGDYDYTSFAFGSSTTLVRDFVVTSTTPTGEGTVTIDAVNYAPDIFTGAMSFMT